MTAYLNRITHEVKRGTTVLATLWIPQEKWITVVAAVAWWYGRRVALTYAPGIIANYFINNTAAYLGSETLGRMIGATIIAPAVTPSLVPWVATVAGFGAFVLIAIICNIALYIFRCSRGGPKPEAQTPEPAPTKA